ncbi:MAG: hypothetical protein RIC18_04970 [Hoeflea sp.]|uniref:hypothetical protein n=1 Tax=Hoeflea sp. TaxID=1940281 RepID=UPI0032F059B5
MRRSFALTSAMSGPANCRSGETLRHGVSERLAGAGKTFGGVAPIGEGYMDSKNVERLCNDVFLSQISFARSASVSRGHRFARNPECRRESRDDQAGPKDARLSQNRQMIGCARDQASRYDRQSSFKTLTQSGQKDADHDAQEQH